MELVLEDRHAARQAVDVWAAGATRVLGLPGNPVSALVCARCSWCRCCGACSGCARATGQVEADAWRRPRGQRPARTLHAGASQGRRARGSGYAPCRPRTARSSPARADCLLVRPPDARPRAEARGSPSCPSMSDLDGPVANPLATRIAEILPLPHVSAEGSMLLAEHQWNRYSVHGLYSGIAPPNGRLKGPMLTTSKKSCSSSSMRACRRPASPPPSTR